MFFYDLITLHTQNSQPIHIKIYLANHYFKSTRITTCLKCDYLWKNMLVWVLYVCFPMTYILATDCFANYLTLIVISQRSTRTHLSGLKGYCLFMLLSNQTMHTSGNSTDRLNSACAVKVRKILETMHTSGNSTVRLNSAYAMFNQTCAVKGRKILSLWCAYCSSMTLNVYLSIWELYYNQSSCSLW